MRKTLFVLSVAVIILIACEQKPKIATVDKEAAKEAIVSVLDKYHSCLFNKDINSMLPLMAEDGLYCGTDSKEFLDKSAISNAMTQMFADTTLKVSYLIDKREVRIAADGNTAIAVDQFIMALISPKIPVRWVFHLVKTGDAWLIDFTSLSLIPNNEDLGKLNGALE
jgi:uncharacterized protein (TIGR02246 family)